MQPFTIFPLNMSTGDPVKKIHCDGLHWDVPWQLHAIPSLRFQSACARVRSSLDLISNRRMLRSHDKVQSSPVLIHLCCHLPEGFNSLSLLCRICVAPGGASQGLHLPSLPPSRAKSRFFLQQQVPDPSQSLTMGWAFNLTRFNRRLGKLTCAMLLQLEQFPATTNTQG